jgi:hypothetical protein
MSDQALASILKNKIKSLLATVDLEITTIKNLQAMLEEDLMIPLEGYKDLIKVGAVIDNT